MSPEGDGVTEKEADMEAQGQSLDDAVAEGEQLEAPSAFKLIYQSRDGRMCLFEDEEGHITAVDGNRLS